ncbi:MAG: ABC transporter permease [bacterium]|nr:ABC transporter permease [bacterium]
MNLQFRNLVKVSVKGILKNRMRSFLTSLGIIIGVAAVIVMVGVGQGASQRIQNSIASMGTNLLIVFPGSSQAGGVNRGAGSWNRFTMEDADRIREQCRLISAVSPLVRSGDQIIGGGNNWNASIYGVSTDYFAIRSWECEQGEVFTDRDVASSRKVAVLGKTTAEALFPGVNPVGERIRIRNTPFIVTGVLKRKGQTSMGPDQDDVVLAPATTVLYRLKGGRYVDMLNVSAASTEQMAEAQEELRAVLRAAHRLRPGDDDDFTIRSQAEITEMATSTTKTMTLLLGAIAAVSLLVGGIGIMNIMLVSVTERTREIGIRMSVGARSRDVMMQFLTEAVVLSLTGGLLGILLAFAVSLVMNRFTSMQTVLRPDIVLLAFTFAGAVGIFFGLHPARKAASLNPIEALRYE